MWSCATCAEQNDANVDDCWNCGTSRYSQAGDAALWHARTAYVLPARPARVAGAARVEPAPLFPVRAVPVPTSTRQPAPVEESEWHPGAWSLKVGVLWGFPVRLHATLLIWLLLLLPGIVSLKTFAFLMGSILVHELAHAVTCRLGGFGSGSITLWLFGGYFIPLELDRLPTQMNWEERKRYAMMIFAGPLSNVVLATLASVAGLVAPSDSLATFARWNFLIALLNLIPAPPLDGEKLVVALGLSYFSRRRIHQMLAVGLLGIVIFGCYGTFTVEWLPSGSLGYTLVGVYHAWKLSKKTDEELEQEYRKAIHKEREASDLPPISTSDAPQTSPL